jgi:hypothetical protein
MSQNRDFPQNAEQAKDVARQNADKAKDAARQAGQRVEQELENDGVYELPRTIPPRYTRRR